MWLVWYIGNCYILCQIEVDCLLICEDYVFVDMLLWLSVDIECVIEFFIFEGGVYGYGWIYGYEY